MNTPTQDINALNPQQHEILNHVNHVLLSTGLFTECGAWKPGDKNEIRIFATPKIIFKDMIEEGITPENFAYSITMPGDQYLMTTKDILDYAAKITMDMLKIYAHGHREVIFINKYRNTEEENDNTTTPESGVAEAAGG